MQSWGPLNSRPCLAVTMRLAILASLGYVEKESLSESWGEARRILEYYTNQKKHASFFERKYSLIFVDFVKPCTSLQEFSEGTARNAIMKNINWLEGFCLSTWLFPFTTFRRHCPNWRALEKRVVLDKHPFLISGVKSPWCSLLHFPLLFSKSSPSLVSNSQVPVSCSASNHTSDF